MEISLALDPAWSRARRLEVCTLAGRLGYAAVVVADIGDRELRRAAAPALVRARADGPGAVRRADPGLVGRARRLVGPGGRVVVDVPLAIGRTRSEAVARALRDPRFAGDAHPELHGIFGALEEAQAQVRALAAAGADELCVTPADEIDLADLLAQARTLVAGPMSLGHVGP